LGDDQRQPPAVGGLTPCGRRAAGGLFSYQLLLDQALEYTLCRVGLEFQFFGKRQERLVVVLGGGGKKDELGIGELGHGVLLS